MLAEPEKKSSLKEEEMSKFDNMYKELGKFFGTAQKRAVKWGKKMIIAIGIKFESGEIILISRVLNEEGSDRRMDWIPEAIPNEVFGSLFFPGRYVGNLRFLGRPAVRDHAVGKFRISVGISSKDNKSDRDLAAQICSNIWVNS